MVRIRKKPSSTGRLKALVSGGDGAAAGVGEQGELDIKVNLDAQDVGLDDGAEASSGLEVDQALDEGAAVGATRRVADDQVEQAVEQVDADAELQGVDRAMWVGWVVRLDHRWLVDGGLVDGGVFAGRVAGGGALDEHHCHQKGREDLGCHLCLSFSVVGDSQRDQGGRSFWIAPCGGEFEGNGG
uniref:Uncharacterized protein n=1 Tax=Nymphaea colorata TaxID=210225 RepID=A0A5K0YNI3_9MAGN|nr:unnamed protein product [Nymphaea colorata]